MLDHCDSFGSIVLPHKAPPVLKFTTKKVLRTGLKTDKRGPFEEPVHSWTAA